MIIISGSGYRVDGSVKGEKIEKLLTQNQQLLD